MHRRAMIQLLNDSCSEAPQLTLCVHREAIASAICGISTPMGDTRVSHGRHKSTQSVSSEEEGRSRQQRGESMIEITHTDFQSPSERQPFLSLSQDLRSRALSQRT